MENLKRARLRVFFSQPLHCKRPRLNFRVVNKKSGRVLGDYVISLRHSGVHTIGVTKAIKKLTTRHLINGVKIKIILLDHRDHCSKVVNALSSEVYLVTNTDELVRRVERSVSVADNDRLPYVHRSSFDSVTSLMRRWKRAKPTCDMTRVKVNLKNAKNSTFILPESFKTGICGRHRPTILSGADAMLKQLAAAITNTIKSLPHSKNSPCCAPSKFEKLTVLYYDQKDKRMQHVVLRHVDKVKVVGCACSWKVLNTFVHISELQSFW